MVSLQTQALPVGQLLNCWFAKVDIYKPRGNPRQVSVKAQRVFDVLS